MTSAGDTPGAAFDGVDIDGVDIDGVDVDGVDVDGVDIDGVDVDGVDVDGNDTTVAWSATTITTTVCSTPSEARITTLVVPAGRSAPS